MEGKDLAAPANVADRHRPRQSTPPPPDGQENEDHVSTTCSSACRGVDKSNTREVRADSELGRKEEAIGETLETIDTLQKSTRQTQLENGGVTVQLQDVITIKRGSMEKIRAAREMCDDLKGQSSSVQQTFTGVEAAVEEMGTAQWDLVIKLTIKDGQAKEKSELLELRNEELKGTSHTLQDSISNCAGLKELKRIFPTRLEQAQEEINTLKLEMNRRQEAESTPQILNAESGLAEEERALATGTTEPRQSRGPARHEHREQNVIVQNPEEAKDQSPGAAGQRCSDSAEKCSSLETNIRGKNTAMDDATTAGDSDNAKHQETLIKDLESEIASLKRQHELARSNSAAELADCMEQIKRLREINSRSISAEIEEVKIRAEKAAQLKITEMLAVGEEYKRQCDRNLEAKDKDYCSLRHKHQEALENAQTSNGELRAEIETLKEELKRKTSPLPAPVTVAKSASKRILKRKLRYWSDSESSEGMDLTFDERLLESASCATPPKRSNKAGAAGEARPPTSSSRRGFGDAAPVVAAALDQASEVSGRAASTRKVARGEVVAALPPSESPAQGWHNVFDWFEGPEDVFAFEPALPPSESPAQGWHNVFDWFEGPEDVFAFEPED